ncbi:MAG: phosphoenolpyruvate--protein phosphotransferase [Cellulomonas sp.]|nr:phosphoenolpyruvate--protein phosphotransferase [Cellulomonas sp.]
MATTTGPDSTPAPGVVGATQLHGVGVGRGGVVGPVAQVRPVPQVPADAAVLINGVAARPDEVRGAVEAAFVDVADRLRRESERAPGVLAGVLAATAEMAVDPALRAKVLARMDDGEGAVGAITIVVAEFAAMFEQAGGHLAERVTDLRSVRDRVIAEIVGLPAPGVPHLTEPSVVVAQDLAPADTAALDLTMVLAIVTELGGPTGHTAIIARQLGLPCVVQTAGATELADGLVVAVDASAGIVTVEPGNDLRRDLDSRNRLEQSFASDIAPGASSDGTPFGLLANIGTAADAARLTDSPVEGVGLFRTEVLFLDRVAAPTVEEQSGVYAEVLRSLAGRKVVVRTLDAGADKPLAFAHQSDEPNPALGIRGYRLVRTMPELLDTQLQALARAERETGIKAWVMAPMIATPAEARDFAAAARAKGLSMVGVMVEIPAAALRAREILAEVDFVSVGTNDLAQYAMATDRTLGELGDLLDPWQPAVLDLIAMTARAGLDLGKPVGVCGESASDPLLALVLAGFGVTTLSMSASAAPAVRFSLRRHSTRQLQDIAAAARGAADAPGARAAALALVDDEVRMALQL